MSDGNSRKVPSYRKSRSGEVMSDRRIVELNRCHKGLKRRQTPEERIFTRLMSGFTVKGRRGHALWFTPQKQFNISHNLAYFVDFYFRDSRVAVEIDGNQHHYGVTKEWDTWRTKILESFGVLVVRFDNADVEHDGPGVVRSLLTSIQQHANPAHARRVRSQVALVAKHRPDFYRMIFPDSP